MQWMFFEQHSLEPNIGAAYFWLALIKGGRDLQQHALEDWMENGYRALGVMEMHLASRRFFAADRFTIADIALYAYTHVAHQCDFDLARFPAIRAWLDRVAAEPGHVAMDWQPEALSCGAVIGRCSPFVNHNRHENAAVPQRLCRNGAERPPASARNHGTIGQAIALTGSIMRNAH